MSDTTVSDFINDFLKDPEMGACITRVHRLPAVAARWAQLPEGLDPRLTEALATRGYKRLYTHQRLAWEHARAGRDFVVVTPTASGKTLCYNLPTVQALLESPDARALYLFPTKALSQDQQAEMNALLGAGKLPVKVATYDGDTPQSVRASARDAARIVITNPDMLHSGVLPNHAKWIKFFTGLRFIVVDEMHTYRGVFGSHVANVLRRLLRIASFYGSKPSFIFCSATIGNPAELAQALCGRPVEAISENGAPRAEKALLLYNPPLVDPVQGIRKSSALESRTVAAKLLERGVRTILFARSRLRVEIIASYLNEHFANLYTDNHRLRIEPYRSGLLPNERRDIEKGLRDGSIQGVVSTNALELGIDIGGLDAAVIAGWPGSLASFWQQAGRAGRRDGMSLAVYVASSSPVDQYLVEHPDRFLQAAAEAARIDPENPYIFMDHVKCAAFELPFAEDAVFGPIANRELTLDGLSMLEEEGLVRLTGQRWHWSADSYPSEKISLRSASADNVVIVDTTQGANTVIGEMDRPSAKELVFKDAVYMHRGRQFIVLELDIEKRICRVEERELNYYTDAVTKFDIKVLSEDDRALPCGQEAVLGDLLVRSRAEKFKKLRFHSHENIGYGEIYLPPEEMQTRALAVLFQPDSAGAQALLALGDESKQAVALSGILSLIRSLAPIRLLCDFGDLGGSYRVRDDHYGVLALYLWDRYPGGTGLCEALLELMPDVLADALSRLGSCDCGSGCPSCAGLDQAEDAVRGFRKRGALAVLSAIVRS